ncbi:MAG: glutathione peroxidase [Bacteroidetes bacterium]|jgi:glutathione peroxidase|nr:glutathione peroxidase [Bacteroidota bacterium]
MRKTLHDYTAHLITGTPVPLDQYRGKVLLLVNTASHCGLAPQLKELEQLHQRYKDQAFEVLGFPSGDFKNQELGTDTEIGTYCQRNYGVSFPMFAKGHVRGPQAQPVFQFLTSRALNGRNGFRPFWNFTKYLIDKQGRLQRVYLPFVKPTSQRITRQIDQLLRP